MSNMATTQTIERQPRERAVPCINHGLDPRTKRPRVTTFNLDAICDACKAKPRD